MSIWQHFTCGAYRQVVSAITDKKRIGLSDLGRNNFDYFDDSDDSDDVKAKVVFSSFDEYRCTLGLGAKIEEAVSDKGQTKSFVTYIRVLKPEPGDILLTALLKVPKDDVDKIEIADRGRINFADDDSSTPLRHCGRWLDASWGLRFIASSYNLPPGFMTVSLQKPTKEEADGRRISEPQTISWPEGLSSTKRVAHILKEKGTGCKVVTLPRHSVFPYVFQAFQQLDKLDLGIQKILVGSRKRSERSGIYLRDVYSPLLDKTQVAQANMDLNESQMEAIRQARKAPEGFVIAHGGPGTGKTQ